MTLDERPIAEMLTAARSIGTTEPEPDFDMTLFEALPITAPVSRRSRSLKAKRAVLYDDLKIFDWRAARV